MLGNFGPEYSEESDHSRNDHSDTLLNTLLSAIALPPAPAGFTSLIIADFPAFFADFRGKGFTLLWRGVRDGFGARSFQGRCGSHAPTLTLIEDTEGNIFGGFTPLKWEPRWPRSSKDSSNCPKADPSLKGFVFTVKNPHTLPLRRFALLAEANNRAITCDSPWGPRFAGAISVFSNYNANSRSFTSLGRVYANNTGLERNTVLTGSSFFTVKEIEVFEITD
jgi:hypothetical protein